MASRRYCRASSRAVGSLERFRHEIGDTGGAILPAVGAVAPRIILRNSTVCNTRNVASSTTNPEPPPRLHGAAGTGQISNGAAVINLVPVFGQTVNTEMDYHVFLTPEGDPSEFGMLGVTVLQTARLQLEAMTGIEPATFGLRRNPRLHHQRSLYQYPVTCRHSIRAFFSPLERLHL
jgi:hypothetical protein